MVKFNIPLYHGTVPFLERRIRITMCTRSELQALLREVSHASSKLYGDKLNKIILYGSYARGDQTEESDIDIMKN